MAFQSLDGELGQKGTHINLSPRKTSRTHSGKDTEIFLSIWICLYFQLCLDSSGTRHKALQGTHLDSQDSKDDEESATDDHNVPNRLQR